MNARARLLVVDDEPINIQTLNQILRDDYEIFSATSGESAIAFCRAYSPDLVLIDIVMPGMDGLETCRRLKADVTTRNIPLLFVTVHGAPELEVEALEAGGSDFISKPVNPAVVRARVRTHLALKAQNEHLEQLVATRTSALRIALEAAEDASRAKGIFLATISHELRTPLNAIFGFTALASRLTQDPKLQRYLEQVNGSATHLLSLVDDVLEASRLAANQLTLARHDFRLETVLREVEQLSKPQVLAKGLTFSLEIAPALFGKSFSGDPDRLKQILLTLVGNAVKFTASGSVTVHVLRMQMDEGGRSAIRFEVQDTGVGIAVEDQKRIFYPFEQADGSSTRKYGGLGIGLNIAKRLVQLMGGEMGITSSPGQGSTFWFTVLLEA